MGEDPAVIRREIEQQRDEMSETVDALGHKADVKGRAKEAIGQHKDALVSKVGGSTPDSGEVKEGARRAAGVAQENPLGLAIGAAAVGFVAGMLVPSTKVENQKLGPMADQVKERAKETGQEALERGKQVAQEAAESAKETAQESGRQQAEELRSSGQQHAEEVGAAAPGGSS
jgi:gas vesicle protein